MQIGTCALATAGIPVRSRDPGAKQQEVTIDRDDRTAYDDGEGACDEQGVSIRHYYCSSGAKRVPESMLGA